jgi:hypothetical protein
MPRLSRLVHLRLRTEIVKRLLTDAVVRLCELVDDERSTS